MCENNLNKDERKLKIGFIGTHGVGKTTLLNMLKELLIHDFDLYKEEEVGIVTEVARKSPYPINEGTTLKSQKWILENQIKAELVYELSGKKKIILSDRTVVDNLAYLLYAEQYGKNKKELELFVDSISKYIEEVDTWLEEHPYNLIFYIQIPDGIENPKEDGIRSGNGEFQNKVDKIIQELLKGKFHLKLNIIESLDLLQENIMEEENTIFSISGKYGNVDYSFDQINEIILQYLL